LRFHEQDTVDPLAVGDRVRVRPSGEDLVVEEVLARRNSLSRPASGRANRRQVIAANLDLVVIVMSVADPPWKPATVDRYLVLASRAGIPGLLCLSKIDLAPEAATHPALEVYRGLGIPALVASTIGEPGVGALAAALTGKVGVLLGPSGTGKSSLLNALAPGLDLPVGEVSGRTGKGQHTTSWVEMLDLPGGGHVVDSPGLRVLDLTGVEPGELEVHFPEIRARAGACRFPDCRHVAEPDCAVKLAVENGELAPFRYDSYQRIRKSLESGRG
jgi:ribosome biogenesis GTPase